MDGWRATIGRILTRRCHAPPAERRAAGYSVAGTVMRQANILNRNCVMVAREQAMSYDELPVLRCRCGHRVEQHRYAETREGESYTAKCAVKKCECLRFISNKVPTCLT